MSRIHPGTPPSRRRSRDDWRSQISKATRLVIQGCRAAGIAPEALRSRVIDGAREALSGSPGNAMSRTAEIPGEKDPQVERMVSAAGIFRMVLAEHGIDWADQVLAESVMAEIIGTLDGELPG